MRGAAAAAAVAAVARGVWRGAMAGAGSGAGGGGGSVAAGAGAGPPGPEARHRLVWVDLEMTGLDVERDHILEMACLVTDADLNLVAEGPNLIIHQPDEVLEGMSEWCKEHHGKSGLTSAVRESAVSLREAELEFLSFVRQQTPPGLCPLAGNSVHADRRFLEKHMPQFLSHLHYRIVDVSTVKELCRRWFPEEFASAPKKALSHRALEDIKESVKELQFYRKAVFKGEAPGRKPLGNGEALPD